MEFHFIIQLIAPKPQNPKTPKPLSLEFVNIYLLYVSRSYRKCRTEGIKRVWEQ